MRGARLARSPALPLPSAPSSELRTALPAGDRAAPPPATVSPHPPTDQRGARRLSPVFPVCGGDLDIAGNSWPRIPFRSTPASDQPPLSRPPPSLRPPLSSFLPSPPYPSRLLHRPLLPPRERVGAPKSAVFFSLHRAGPGGAAVACRVIQWGPTNEIEGKATSVTAAVATVVSAAAGTAAAAAVAVAAVAAVAAAVAVAAGRPSPTGGRHSPLCTPPSPPPTPPSPLPPPKPRSPSPRRPRRRDRPAGIPRGVPGCRLRPPYRRLRCHRRRRRRGGGRRHRRRRRRCVLRRRHRRRPLPGGRRRHCRRAAAGRACLPPARRRVSAACHDRPGGRRPWRCASGAGGGGGRAGHRRWAGGAGRPGGRRVGAPWAGAVVASAPRGARSVAPRRVLAGAVGVERRPGAGGGGRAGGGRRRHVAAVPTAVPAEQGILPRWGTAKATPAVPPKGAAGVGDRAAGAVAHVNCGGTPSLLARGERGQPVGRHASECGWWWSRRQGQWW
ncbi:hypothetical protein I4F81_001467 [Pyropia yezoensis]|uniref:Uncharacterized protein n=1 Tax=Pyropia yezoensis TaxID=2788 RepID=A0ACC3BMY9_PYRYE|nr:hypothetical protein I4F81_001467 [Neopyropia yezoensis]